MNVADNEAGYTGDRAYERGAGLIVLVALGLIIGARYMFSGAV